MTRTLTARTGSGAAGLAVVYVGALLAVTNLIFSADATASTRLPGTAVRTGTYAVSLAAAPAAWSAAPEVAPVIATPPVPAGSEAVKAVVTSGAQEQPAGSSDQVTNSRRDGTRPGRSSAGGGTLFRPRNRSGAGARTT